MQVHMAVCHELWPIRLLRLTPTIQYIDLPVDSSGNMKGIKPLTTVIDAAKCSVGFLLQIQQLIIDHPLVSLTLCAALFGSDGKFFNWIDTVHACGNPARYTIRGHVLTCTMHALCQFLEFFETRMSLLRNTNWPTVSMPKYRVKVHTWRGVVTCKCTWTGVVAYKCTWRGVVACKCTWRGVVACKCTWRGVAACKCTWRGVVTCKCTWRGVVACKCMWRGVVACRVHTVSQSCS